MSIVYTLRQRKLIDEHRDINVDYDGWANDSIAEFARQLEAYGIDIPTHTVKLMSGDTREDPDIFWSGFWSQGDGASFDCRGFTIDKLLAAGQRVMTLPDDHELSYLKDSSEPVPTKLREMYRWLESEFATCLLSGEAMALLQLADIQTTLVRGHYSHSGNMIVELNWQGDEKEDYNETDQQLIGKLEAEGERMQQTLRQLADALWDTLYKEHEHLTEDEQVWEAITNNDLDKNDEEEADEERDQAA